MKKRIIAAVIILALIGAFIIVPKVNAESGTYEEAVTNFKKAVQTLTEQSNIMKEKIETVRSLSKDIHTTLQEMKKEGKEIPESAKADLKKLNAIRRRGEKERDIREARAFYSKAIWGKMQKLKKEIKNKKENGATKEELKPLFERMKSLGKKLKNVAPIMPEKMQKKADEILKKAETLKNEGKEKEAIRLLDNATKSYTRAANAIKNRLSKMDELINLLTKIKGELNG